MSVKCEWIKGCKGKPVVLGHHWGKTFGVCAKHEKRAELYYLMGPLPVVSNRQLGTNPRGNREK